MNGSGQEVKRAGVGDGTGERWWEIPKLCPSIFASRRQFDKLKPPTRMDPSDTQILISSFVERLTGSHKFC